MNEQQRRFFPFRPDTRRPHSGPLDPELHVAAAVRDHLKLEARLFSLEGEVIVANLENARTMAQTINESREVLENPDAAIRASDINAMGLIDEILHYVIDLYEEEHGADVWNQLLDFLSRRIEREAIDSCLKEFLARFPTAAIYRGETETEAYLATEADGKSGREVASEELLMLWLENVNPAYRVWAEAFDDSTLRRSSAYEEIIAGMGEFFTQMPTFGPDDESLVAMLRRPAIEHPDSLEDQLEFIRTRWARVIGRYFFRLLRGCDLLREERRYRGGGPGPAAVLRFDAEHDERARFSRDRDWMPHVVLLAKNVLVWLYQLSRQHGREIQRLDEIPDHELDLLAERGFNALWLIGIWQRSAASRRIKHLCGNPEAVASAYALSDYEIADDIGGWDALNRLAERCALRNIQLASDMVPNHTGLDSRWVVEHPDWFVQVDRPPFPSYSYNGEDLCAAESITVQIEDHYFDRSDAAVVFRRIDHRTGDTRYIYHGNDGTHMPWNDTAQLNFLNPEVREAVIQTILHVARSFRIIRFDAAMTLAKQHYQRLWFPAPGSGGDIPSRSEHGLTKEAFDRAVPQEFWREVVDRVAAEAPNTLLLAEAFWMMEGYFVRSLGMHRVYNSAFMNMLKNEENQKYRQTIKNVIEFDREILKRFVNFMSNPDEETAIQQFGTGDKYFGVCTLMVTMPGLPMFGHGQIEGYAEKYGMEYRRAYEDETPNPELVSRHYREIFPLLARRNLFAHVKEFCLYDAVRDDGGVTEDIFAYTNSIESEAVLVVYNNSLSHRWGWIAESATFAEKTDAGERVYRRRQLAEALGVWNDHRRYCIFRELRTGLWFIRNSRELANRGLFLSLSGYQCQVFGDFHEVTDNELAHYAQLADALSGSGVPDIEEALKELLLKPLYDSFASVANSGLLFSVGEALLGRTPISPEQIEVAVDAYRSFAEVAAQFVHRSCDPEAATRRFRRLLSSSALLRYRGVEAMDTRRYRRAVAFFAQGLDSRQGRVEPFLAFILFLPLATLISDGRQTLGLIENWFLDRRLIRVTRMLGFHVESAGRLQMLLRLMFEYHDWLDRVENPAACSEAFLRMLDAPAVAEYLEVNRFDGTLWFNRERFRELTWWLFVLAAIETSEDPATVRERRVELMCRAYSCVERWRKAEEASDYRLSELTELLRDLPSEGQDDVD